MSELTELFFTNEVHLAYFELYLQVLFLFMEELVLNSLQLFIVFLGPRAALDHRQLILENHKFIYGVYIFQHASTLRD